jgi:putative chitinase
MEYLRISESYTSLILGIVVVIIASVLLISFIKGNQFGQTPPPAPEISATKIEPLVSPTAAEMAQSEAVTPTPGTTQSVGKGTYTVQPGDDLWHIAEKVYNDGYKWTLIAKANNIMDPGTIFAGNVLKTPSVSTIDETKGGQTAQSQQAQMPGQQPAIAGSSYKVEHGDTLWSIAERRYNDGYRWVDIAKANNLSDPNLIHADNTLTLPQ